MSGFQVEKMREIKFRAWDNEGNRMLIPVVPTLDGGISWGKGSYDCLSEKYQIMQYTGLKDVNGKEIYEGDIISYTGHFVSGKPKNLRVGWDENNCCWRGFYGKDEGHVLSNFLSNSIEVIGNLYENPKLLEKV